MRKLFLAGFVLGSLIMPAMAADMTPYYRAPVQALPFNWTGAYIGADVGGAWANIQSNRFGTGSTSGAVGGLYAGYNWQFAPQWLFGVDLDMSWPDLSRVNCKPRRSRFSDRLPLHRGARECGTRAPPSMGELCICPVAAVARIYRGNRWIIFHEMVGL